MEDDVRSRVGRWRSDLKDQKPVLYKLKEDVAIFSAFFFPPPQGYSDYFLYAWQDVIAQDKSQLRAVCTSRQIGKTTVAAIEALHFAFFNDNETVLVLSRTFPQAVEVIKRMKDFMRTSLSKGFQSLSPNERESKCEIKIRNRKDGNYGRTYSRIISVVASDAARGYSPGLVICDEAAFWEDGDYIFNRVVMPSIAATQGRCLVVSTPNGRMGFFPSLFNLPQWSAHTFDYTHGRLSSAFIDGERKRLPLMEFQSEYEAKFVSPKAGYFSFESVKEAAEKESEGAYTEGMVGLGVDLGKEQDNSVITVVGVDNPDEEPSTWRVRVLEMIVKPLNTPYSQVVEEVRDVWKRWQAGVVCVDTTGVGAGPAEELESLGLPVQRVLFSLKGKRDIYSTLKVLLEQRRITIPNDKTLVDELSSLEYEMTSGGGLKIKTPEGAHDDRADSLCLATFGLVGMQSASASAEFVISGESGAGEVRQSKTLSPCSVCDGYHFGEHKKMM